MAKWNDISAHSRSETDRTPKTWEMKGPCGLRIVVTRHIHYPKDQWLLVCAGVVDGQYELEAKDIMAAKREALTLVATRLHEMAEFAAREQLR